MENEHLIKEIYQIADKNNVILKGNIIINGNTQVVLFAHYCKSTLFYKHFFSVTKETLKVNKYIKKNLHSAKSLVKSAGYNKIWTKGVFSFYGDLRPLAVAAGLGNWGNDGLICNDKYGTNFLLSVIFFLQDK